MLLRCCLGIDPGLLQPLLQALLSGNAGCGLIQPPLAGEPSSAHLFPPDRHLQQVDMGSIFAPQSSWHSRCFEDRFKSGQVLPRSESCVAVTTQRGAVGDGEGLLVHRGPTLLSDGPLTHSDQQVFID